MEPGEPSPEPVASVAPDASVETVAQELRLVVGRVRSPTGFAEMDLPVLDSLAGGDRDGVSLLITRAIERVDSEQYRVFLATLLPFPFQPATPWEQLGPNRNSDGRGERAARSAFSLSWDACNRAGQLLDGRSRRDWAEQFLAEAVLAEGTVAQDHSAIDGTVPTAAPATAPHDADHTHIDLSGTGESTGRGRRRVLILTSAVVGVLAIVGAAMAVGARQNDGDENASATTTTTAAAAAASGTAGSGTEPQVDGETTVSQPTPCHEVGELGPTVANDDAAQQLSEQFIDLYKTLPTETGCPSASAYRWDNLVVQELDSGEFELPAAMLIEPTGPSGWYMTPTAYATYRRLGSGDGSIAQDLGGLPGELVTFPDGHQEMLLSAGVLLVAEQEGAPFFWLPADFVDLWRDSTATLGLPAGNPMPKLIQDFHLGFARLYQKDNQPVITILDDPGESLPPIEDLRGKVLHQEDGTSWYIGEDGRRYWIPTGAVWQCLVRGHDDEVPDFRAYAISSIPYGGHAQCPNN